MKNKAVNRLIALGTTLTILLCGCGGTEKPAVGSAPDRETQTAASQSAAAGENAATGETPVAGENANEDMITFTFSKSSYPSVTLPEGQTPDDNVVLDYIRDNYQVDMKLAWQAEGSEYNNKLSLNIASGNLPDIFYCNDYRTFLQLAQNGLLADLTDIYEENISDTIKGIDASYGGRNLEPVTIDGRLMAIPAGNLDGQQDVLWLRKDWLDNLGLEVPKTMEDLEKVLTAFVEEDPDGNGVDDTTGLTVDATKPVARYNHAFGLEPIFYAFGVYPNYWMEDENGEIYYGSTDERMKEVLTLLQDWYKKGLIDRQFATRIGSGETEAVFTSGQSGAYFGAVHANYTDAFTNNPDIELVAVAAPLDGSGKYNYVLPEPTSSMLCISSKCADPARAVKIIGIGNDLYRGFDEKANEIFNAAGIASSSNGRRAVFPQGSVTYDYFDIIEKLGKAVKENIETGSYTEYEGMTQYDKDQVVLATQYADGSDKTELSFKSYYYRYVGSNLLSGSEMNPHEAAYYYTTDSSASLQAELDTLEQEMYLSIIIGEKSVDYFDDFVTQWKNICGDTLLEEVKQVLGR